MLFPTTKLLGACAAAGLAFTAQAALAQITLINPTTNNGSFESNIDGAGGGKIDPLPTTTADGTPTAGNPVPDWAVTTAQNDTGIQSGAGLNEDGIYGAFEQPGASIFNLVTSRTIQTGDVYTLTFYADDTQTHGGTPATSTLGVTFFSQAATAPGSTYGFAGTALSTTSVTLTNASVIAGTDTLTEYTATYTALPTDAGNDIGIELTNTSTDYNGLDNFNLTVIPVPEPSTYALMAAGLMGLGFLRRRTRV